MTTLMAFVSVDRNGQTAFYIASDSRVAWGKTQHWDAARKVFNTRQHAHAFAYCGDVTFPSLVLSQLVELADAGALFADVESHADRHKRVSDAIRTSFERRKNAPDRSFDVVHVSRRGRSNQTAFELSQLSFDANKRRWVDISIEVPTEKSSLVLALGTGAPTIREHERRSAVSEIGGTSRSIFTAFCDSLASGGDTYSGGPPQLVGIYRDGPAKAIGIIHARSRYFCGLPVPDGIDFNKVEWRDDLFQRIDGENMRLLANAQAHVRPRQRS